MKLSKIFLAYLKMVEKTSKITYHNLDVLKDSIVLGFWHEDSFISHIVLKELEKNNQKATVLVTGHWRGNVIQEMIEHYAGDVFRVQYHEKNVEQYKKLFKFARTTENIIVLAFDGPKGPRHKVKKIGFLMANKNKRNFVGLRIRYKRKLRILSRWDHYVIPLLFNNIHMEFMDFGTIENSVIQDPEEMNQLIFQEMNN